MQRRTDSDGALRRRQRRRPWPDTTLGATAPSLMGSCGSWPPALEPRQSRHGSWVMLGFASRRVRECPIHEVLERSRSGTRPWHCPGAADDLAGSRAQGSHDHERRTTRRSPACWATSTQRLGHRVAGHKARVARVARVAQVPKRGVLRNGLRCALPACLPCDKSKATAGTGRQGGWPRALVEVPLLRARTGFLCRGVRIRDSRARTARLEVKLAALRRQAHWFAVVRRSPLRRRRRALMLE